MGTVDTYRVVPGVPIAVTVNALRRAGGLTPYNEAALARGLPNTVFGVMIRAGDETVGMGRVIGDGGCVFQVVDIVVHPDHQGRGLGRRIMDAIDTHIRDALPAGAYVSLIADRPADRLYAQFGFAPSAPAAIGMERWTGA